jgi:hypothetical protein
MPSPSPRAPIAATIAMLALTLLAGCGTYEPPQPGKHAGPGEPRADVLCSYETPTASTFVRMRCDRATDLNARGEEQRRELESARMGGTAVN